MYLYFREVLEEMGSKLTSQMCYVLVSHPDCPDALISSLYKMRGFFDKDFIVAMLRNTNLSSDWLAQLISCKESVWYDDILAPTAQHPNCTSELKKKMIIYFLGKQAEFLSIFPLESVSVHEDGEVTIICSQKGV